jgi:hypothetical protein
MAAPGNKNELNDAIRDLYNNQQRVRLYGTAARERVIGHFRPEDASTKFVSVINHVANQ